MGRLIVTLGNRSARVFAYVCVVITAAVFIGAGAVHRYENHSAALYENEYRLSLAGRLAELGLGREEIGELITAEITPEYVSAGSSALSGYGISPGKTIGGEYAYAPHVWADLLAAAGALICLAAGLCSLGAVFKDMRELTGQLEHDEDIAYPEDRDTVLLCEAVSALKKKTAHLIDRIGDEKQYLADYLNDFSHQIKTPCTGLMLNNDILSSAPMDFEEQQDYFRRDRKCLERISLLVAASLKLARLDAGAIEYNIEQVDISEMVSEAVLQLSGIAKENTAELVNKTGRGITLDCDRLWLCEAVTNLVKNAAEHTHGGQVVISADSDPMTVRLYIEDNGCGISEEDLPKVFHRFYSKSMAVNSNSVGIGMSAAKRIVEDMNGRLFIESEVGKGTKITLEFLRGGESA